MNHPNKSDAPNRAAAPSPTPLKLVIGNKNYSTWSMRAWVFLTAFDVPFDEIVESLADETTLRRRLLAHSPAARAPALIDGDLTVWDSLAICEYINDAYLAGAALPADPRRRARARAIIAEIHAGFADLRDAMPMNIRARRWIEITRAVARDISRIADIFAAANPWLSGDRFGMTDCFYAPVAMRFATYADINLLAPAAAYCERLRDHPAVRLWIEQALRESEIVGADEVGEDIKA